MRILIVEDDRETASFLERELIKAGEQVTLAATGQEALGALAGGAFDAVVLDRMLPDTEGLQLLKTARENLPAVPTIFLTALGDIEDRVAGLQAGDDYLVKPFDFAELYARLCALTRRFSTASEPLEHRVADLQVDLLTRSVVRAGHAITLQPTEFKLLAVLLRHRGQIVTRTMLLKGVWDFDFDPNTNIVESHISRLRAKVDKGFDVPVIHTVRGEGYKISETA